MFMYLEEYNSLTKIILIIVLLALVSGTHAFNSSFAYALEEDEKEPGEIAEYRYKSLIIIPKLQASLLLIRSKPIFN